MLVAGDQRRGEDVAAPIARNVMIAHMDVRRRGTRTAAQRSGPQHRAVDGSQSIARRAERWSDMLIGGLVQGGEALQFAVEPERALDFAADLGRDREEPGGRQAWQMTLVAARRAFHAGLSPTATNGDTNARIVAAILGCFSDDLFDSTGLFQSLWMMRLSATASDAQGLVSELLEPKLRRLPAFQSPASRWSAREPLVRGSDWPRPVRWQFGCYRRLLRSLSAPGKLCCPMVAGFVPFGPLNLGRTPRASGRRGPGLGNRFRPVGATRQL